MMNLPKIQFNTLPCWHLKITLEWMMILPKIQLNITLPFWKLNISWEWMMNLPKIQLNTLPCWHLKITLEWMMTFPKIQLTITLPCWTLLKITLGKFLPPNLWKFLFLLLNHFKIFFCPLFILCFVIFAIMQFTFFLSIYFLQAATTLSMEFQILSSALLFSFIIGCFKLNAFTRDPPSNAETTPIRDAWAWVPLNLVRVMNEGNDILKSLEKSHEAVRKGVKLSPLE